MNIFKQLLLVGLLITGTAQATDLSTNTIKNIAELLNSAIKLTNQEFDQIDEEFAAKKNLSPVELLIEQEKAKEAKKLIVESVEKSLRICKKEAKHTPSYPTKNAVYNAYKAIVPTCLKETGYIPTGFRK